VSALVGAVLTGTVTGGAGAKSNAERPFIVNLAFAPVTLDAPLVTGYPESGFAANFYATLVKYANERIPAPKGVTAVKKDNERIVGYLAKSYAISRDGKTMTFKLHPNLKFSTGRPITSAAVKASLERALNLGATGVYYATAGQGPGLIKGFSTPDRLTFVIRLNRREPLMIHTLTQGNLGIMDIEEIKKQGGDKEDVEAGRVVSNKWIASHTAGSGPYVLSDYRPGARMVLTANPNFVGPAPLEKQVIVNIITDSSTLLLQARNGAADVTWGMAKRAAKSVQGNKCCNVLAVDTHNTQILGFPNKVAPFNNKTFRRALTHAIPYQSLVDKVAAGYGKPFYGLYAPALPGYKNALGKPRAYDLALAKRLIEQSGVSLPVTTELMIQEGNFDQEQIATTVQAEFGKLGVRVNVKKVPDSVYSSTDGIYGDNKTMVIRQDGGAVQDPVWAMDYDVRCVKGAPGFANIQDYCNAKIDALINKLHATVDKRKRQQYLDQINMIWLADSPRVQLYTENYVYVLSKSVKRFKYVSDHQGPQAISEWGR
jgi:peptide/nickel transport system substrate-binding protein